jgi:ribosome recycling factor
MIKKQLKASEISEDEQKGAEDDIQKLTDEFIAKVDNMVDEKSKEIMTV